MATVTGEKDYRYMLRSFLPRGSLWSSFGDDHWFIRLLYGFAPELTRLEARALDLLRESVPTRATELAPEWKRVVLPPDDPDGDIGGNLGQEGGSDAGSMIDAVASFGYRATIDTFPPFRIGHSAIDRPLYDMPWGSAFRVNIFVINAPAVIAAGGLPEVEAVVRKRQPANSHVIFRYLEET